MKLKAFQAEAGIINEKTGYFKFNQKIRKIGITDSVNFSVMHISGRSGQCTTDA